MSIRERDAQGDQWFYAGDVDRRALLAAGDALAEAVQVQHPVSPTMGLDGKLAMVWCDGCNAPEAECWAVRALASWKAAAG